MCRKCDRTDHAERRAWYKMGLPSDLRMEKCPYCGSIVYLHDLEIVSLESEYNREYPSAVKSHKRTHEAQQDEIGKACTAVGITKDERNQFHNYLRETFHGEQLSWSFRKLCEEAEEWKKSFGGGREY